MNAWPFIIGAYAIALISTIALAAASLVAMRRAETKADSLGRPS